MSFETEQLVTFCVMLGAALGITSVALGRAFYLAYRATGQGRTDWWLMVAFLAIAWAFWAFQLWRIIVRF
jgi:energy-converting hydrogenase Eha subunit G